ncbi:winged helix-turn-helix domain-containing protein [Streptomyces sp. NPDC001380]|uniref:winged helix-turn-helix domain-containing protein n=1 Tax=Streptomyces sp. NPDC001380 TaxID=3364566 RepID=UPI0036AA4956
MSNVSTLPATPPTASSPVPHLRALPPHAARTGAAPQSPPQLPQPFPLQLPEGATVLAALPDTALPEQLLARYAADRSGVPMVGYLVLVPASAVPPPAPLPGPDPLPEPDRGPGPGVAVDTDRRTVHVDGVPLDLTYLEFELLAHLTAHPHRVHTRDHLVSAVWGYGHVGDGRTVDVHVARLRRKLGPAHRDSIVTVRRVGYTYAPPARGAGA